jgi:phage terminase large subunit-like protein
LRQCAASIKPDDFLGQVAVMGLDLSTVRDLTAAVLMFRSEEEPGIIYQLPHFWMPEEMARRKNHQVGYLDWAGRGYLTLTPGDVVDYGFVFEDIRKLAERYVIECVMYDPWNAENFTQQIQDELGLERIAFQQSIKNFNGPSQQYERRIINGTLRHPDHPILNWQASHVMIKHDPNQNIRPVKRDVHDYRTIDGIVAGIMALAKAIEEPAPGFCMQLS